MISGEGNQDYLILFVMNLVCSWSCCEAVLAIYAGLLAVYVAQFPISEYFSKTETTKFANLQAVFVYKIWLLNKYLLFL